MLRLSGLSIFLAGFAAQAQEPMAKTATAGVNAGYYQTQWHSASDSQPKSVYQPVGTESGSEKVIRAANRSSGPVMVSSNPKLADVPVMYAGKVIAKPGEVVPASFTAPSDSQSGVIATPAAALMAPNFAKKRGEPIFAAQDEPAAVLGQPILSKTIRR